MGKFNVNQKVYRKSDGKEGVVRAREVKSVDNYTEVRYLVDFGDGIDKWQVVTKKDIASINKNGNETPYLIKTYEVGDGKIITMVAKVDTEKDYIFDVDGVYKTKSKTLSIGFSLYNGIDEYEPVLGQKYAIHRCKSNPFTTMTSSFSGEFNKDTVLAIMDAKAKYIINNMDNFYRPSSSLDVVNGDPSVLGVK